MRFRLSAERAVLAFICGLLVGELLFVASCSNNPPPNLSPQARAAWYGTRAIKGLDLLRDTALDANAQMPPLVSTATTRKIVRYHESAITAIHATPMGWVSTVQA